MHWFLVLYSVVVVVFRKPTKSCTRSGKQSLHRMREFSVAS